MLTGYDATCANIHTYMTYGKCVLACVIVCVQVLLGGFIGCWYVLNERDDCC